MTSSRVGPTITDLSSIAPPSARRRARCSDRGPRRLMGAAATWVGLVVLLAPTASAQPSPTLSTTALPAIAHATIDVEGAGWTPDVPVLLEICGGEGRDRVVDCATDAGAVHQTSADGTVDGSLVVTVPPTPCPCVVRGTVLFGTETATTPITLRAPPGAEPDDGRIVERRLELVDARIRDDGGVPGWFGFAPERTLVFAVRNVGNATVRGARLDLAVGRSGEAGDAVARDELPELEPLGVGETDTYEVPIDLGPLALGEYAVEGTITGLAEPTTLSTSTTHWPWALGLVVVLAVAQFLVLLVLHRRRRGVAEVVRPDVVVPGRPPAPVGAEVPEPAADFRDWVIDLREPATEASIAEEAPPAERVEEPALVPVAAGHGRPAVAPSVLEETVARELGHALETTYADLGDRRPTNVELVELAARIALVTAVRTARRHDLGPVTTRRLLLGVFGELTERLGVGDDLGDLDAGSSEVQPSEAGPSDVDPSEAGALGARPPAGEWS
jgi:hypothetical protein